MHPVERCAACAEPAWRLARALLRDPHAAYDAVQQAFLVAARKPTAVPAGDPWPWFSVVVTHEARNLRRKRRPATNRAEVGGDGGPDMGGGDARPDPRATEPVVAAARAEDVARLLAAVDALPDLEREALELTTLGGLTHAQAAEALGVVRQTVTERARRGLEALGRRLRAGEAATAHALAAVPLGAPAQGLAAATEAWLSTARATGVGTVIQGGTAMATSKAAWVAGVAVAAGLGFVGGGATDGLGLFPADPSPAARGPLAPAGVTGVEASAPSGAPAAGGLAPAATEAATAAARRLEAEHERLVARVAALERDLEAARASGPAAPRGPRFTFGEMGRLEGVVKADWAALATSSKVVTDAVTEIHRATVAGEAVPKEVYVRLQEHVEQMRRYEYRTLGKMPTAAAHNGEFTHPITTTNLLADVLEQGGRPLSEAQVAEFERLGTAFEEEFARLRARWGADVPRARRLLDELRVKGRFTDGLWAALSEAQRPLWVDPALRGVAGVDLYDPTLLVLHTSPVVTGAAVADLRPKLLGILRGKLGVAPDAASPRLEAAVDGFLARTGPGLAAVPKVRAKFYTFADALAAGEASAELVDVLLRDLDLTPEVRKALLDEPAWYIPRLVTP